MSEKAPTAIGRFIDNIEETLIALILASMTLIAFTNVVVRKSGGNILWALEAQTTLAAWLVLLGASYGVKKSLHIGVDIVIKQTAPAVQRIMAIFSVAACITFGVLLLKGSWDYWYPFIKTQAWFETDDLPMPEFLQFFADWLNGGEKYEKMPKFIPYAILPLSMALILFRYIQVAWSIANGTLTQIITSHEGEELLEDNKNDNKDKQI